MNSVRGVALVLAILVTSFLTAIGLGLALMVMTDRLATGNQRGSVAMLYAADAVLELAARDLALQEDWDDVLSGGARGGFVDGEPSGSRAVPGGGTVDLTAVTNQLSCRSTAACSDAQLDATSKERPWGANNARWRLYAYGPLGKIVQFARPADCYVVLWVADDRREADGNPEADAPEHEPGHGIVRVRVEAFGPAGARRALEAELVRECLAGAPDACRPGIRVQSWTEIRQAVP